MCYVEMKIFFKGMGFQGHYTENSCVVLRNLLEQDTANAKVTGSMSVWSIHLRSGLNGPSGLLPTQSIR